MPGITFPQTASFSKGADQLFARAQSALWAGGPVPGVISLVLWLPRLSIISIIATKELAFYALPVAGVFCLNLITDRNVRPLDDAAKFLTKSYVEIAQLWVRTAMVAAVATLAAVSVVAISIHILAIRVGLVQSAEISFGGFFNRMGFRIGDIQNPILLEMHRASGVDKVYQEHLFALVKKGIKEVLSDQTLSGYLDKESGNEVEKGADRILETDGEVLQGVANYIQLLEIEGENKCPEKFEDEPRRNRYDKRSKEISDIKKLLNEAGDKKLLKEALIKSDLSILQENSKEHEIAKRICALAGDLHQGPLMLAASGLNVGNMRHNSEHRFTKAWQEAVGEHAQN